MTRSGLLSGQTKSERIIGYGPQVSWTPQCESPDVQIVVLARNQNGLWASPSDQRLSSISDPQFGQNLW